MSDIITEPVDLVSSASIVKANSTESTVKTDSATFVKKVQKEVVPEQPSAPKKIESVIYIGDSLPVLQQFSVFSNGIPEYLNVEIEKCPTIRELIIPISQLGQSRGQINVQGTREYLLNLQVKKYARR